MKNLSNSPGHLSQTRVLFQRYKNILIIIFLFLFSALSARADSFLDVVVNEIAWMGTEVGWRDEWIELYNNTDFEVNIDGWILKSVDGTLEIEFTGTIPAKSFYLLERTDDNSVLNITADQIYAGALSNKGEHLKLFDNQNNLIDQINCSEGWFAGDNETKQTIERKDPQLPGNSPENWQTSKNPGGTPKAKNDILEKTEPQSEPTQESKKESELKVYPTGIVFNEILPSPAGPDKEEEWIEILNHSSIDVDLSGWKISDTLGVVKTYIFPEGTKIKTGGFLVLWRKETKITLNNDGDKLNLIHPDDKVINSVVYEKAPRGQSFNLTDSTWVWSNTLTPGSENIIPSPEILEDKEQGQSQDKTFEKSKQDIEQVKQELTATIPSFTKNIFKSSGIFFTALFIAVFSGIIILILKKKIKKQQQ